MAPHALKTLLETSKTLDKSAVAEAPEHRWPPRSRFLFIVAAATLCWLVPGVVAYLLLTSH